MKKYVWGRVVRAILSAFIVTVIAMVMIQPLQRSSKKWQNLKQIVS